MKTITSTYLTHNTRVVLNEIEKTKEPVIVKTYNTPRVVVLDFEQWEKIQGNNRKSNKKGKKNSLKKFKKFMYTSGEITNMANIIRKERDEN